MACAWQKTKVCHVTALDDETMDIIQNRNCAAKALFNKHDKIIFENAIL
jgi:hypothetical protein